ncbi:MAG TPA: sigma-70 family RNA polymerase sigma factor [Gaiellales bacterium]|jgi:RNA polymerase sigma-70 factor (ECF subfamily)
MVPTDEEILGALRAGELDESMRTLARAYGGGLYGYALKRLGDPQLAEEVVQEVMVRVWRNAGRFNPRRGTLKAWVYQMAGNLVIDAHRRRSVRPAVAQLDAADEGGEADPLEREILRWQVQELVAQLRPEHREVIGLVHFEGLSVRAAAERLRIPEGTVKSRCYYALESLRVALEEQGLP